MSTTFPPTPFLRPSLLRPAAQQRDARGGSGGAARCHAAPRALPLLWRPRPRGSPGRARPAALPARRACPPAAGRSPGSRLERIHSRRWRCRAAGFKEFTGALCCRGNVCASSSASQPGASPGTAAAGSSPLLVAFVSSETFRPCAIWVPAGVSHPSRPKGHVKFNRTVNISTGTGGANCCV